MPCGRDVRPTRSRDRRGQPVWIANLRGSDGADVRMLRAYAENDDDQLLVGDLVLLEILQGARDEAHAARIERNLRR